MFFGLKNSLTIENRSGCLGSGFLGQWVSDPDCRRLWDESLAAEPGRGYGLPGWCQWGSRHGAMGTMVSLGPLSLGRARALRSSPGCLREGLFRVPDSCLVGEVAWIWCVDGSCGRRGSIHGAAPHVRFWSEGQWRESTFCAGSCQLLHQLEASTLLPHSTGTGPGLCLISFASSCTPARHRLSPTARRKGEAGRVWKGLWSQIYQESRPLLALWPGAGCLSNWTLTASFDRACDPETGWAVKRVRGVYIAPGLHEVVRSKWELASGGYLTGKLSSSLSMSSAGLYQAFRQRWMP